MARPSTGQLRRALRGRQSRSAALLEHSDVVLADFRGFTGQPGEAFELASIISAGDDKKAIFICDETTDLAAIEAVGRLASASTPATNLRAREMRLFRVAGGNGRVAGTALRLIRDAVATIGLSPSHEAA